MNYTQKLSTTLEKEEETIAVLANLSELKLSEKLTLLLQQKETARKSHLTKAVELLDIWAKQVTDALSLKQQLLIPDNPDLDVSMGLPELADYEMIEKRQELLKEKLIGQTKVNSL